MKYTVVAASLLALAAAQPHHGHKHAHKRDNVVMETDYVTATAPDVVVYVDQYGNPIKGPAQATNAPAYAPAPAPAAQPTYAPAAAPAPAPVSAPVSAPAAAPVAPSPKQSSAPVAAPAPASSPSTYAGSNSGSSSGSNSTKKGGLGITYSPYRADGQCKTADEVMSDFDMLTEYSSVRIYNTDCNQIATVGKAAQKHNMEVLAGIFHIDDMSSAIAALASGFSSNWAGISSVAIGNELVNSGQKSVAQVVNAVNTGRTLLRAAGFQGDVVTVDTNNILREPAGKPLCDASDYVAVNAHPFFGSVLPEDSGDWLKTEIQKIQTNCPGKRVVVTESGWPSQGTANGPSIPSEANQKTSIASLKSAMSSDLYLFTAFNDAWKAPGAFNCEQYWGVYGNSAY